MIGKSLGVFYMLKKSPTLSFLFARRLISSMDINKSVELTPLADKFEAKDKPINAQMTHLTLPRM